MRGAAFLALFLTVPLVGQDDQVGRSHARRLDGLPGLENVAQVAPGVLRGSAPTEEGIRTLKARGIRTVINLRHYHGRSEGEACRAAGLGYVRIALPSSSAPREADVRRFLEIVVDPARQPVYFHCWRGKDRTGAMCAVYRIAVEGWSTEEALAEMDAFGPFEGFIELRDFVRRVGREPGRFWSKPEEATPPGPPPAP